MEYQKIWWNKVPSASSLVNEAADALQIGKSVAINNTLGNWTETFIEAVMAEVHSNNYSVASFSVDLKELPENDEIVDGMLTRLGIDDVMASTIAGVSRYLPKAGSIWILKNMDEQHFRKVETLIQQANKCRVPIAFIFLKPLQKKIKGCFDADLRFTKLDLQYYAWTLLLNRQNYHLLEYSSQLAVELCGGMPDRCAKLCADAQQLAAAPEKCCTWLTTEEMISAVHTAQVRSIEPWIEYGRVWLITQLGDRLNCILPFDDEYGNHFENPMDIEFRHIVFYQKKIGLKPNEGKALDFLYESRNRISHLGILAYSEIDKMLRCALKNEWNMLF